MIRTFAAIDVGSFELEMGIYEMSEKGGVHQIDCVRHAIGLGKDTYQNGKISYHMVEEICEALIGFSEIMKSYQVENYRAYAESAVREARNSQIVLDQIRVRTGIDVFAISNSEQRFISYKAIAARDAEFQKTIQKGTAIVDVGFGSTQISLFDKDCLVSTQNLPLGALRLRSLLSQARTTAKGERDLLGELVDNELVTFRKMYLKDRNIDNLIAIGDPILTMYYRIRKQRGNERISAEEFRESYGRLSRMTLDQLEDTYDVNADIAGVLVPAAVVYERALAVTGAKVLWMPGTRLTDGIAAEYAEEKKVLKFNHDFANDIIVTSRNMAKRYKCHMHHVQSVENLALRLFDALKKYHGLKARERLLLQIAADLHSCGKFVAMRNATDCAYNIIMATEIIGLSHLEREIVANVVRYHIEEFRYNEVRIDTTLARGRRLATPNNFVMTVAKLTALLRLANSMDRGHKDKLQDCRITVRDKELVITTDYQGDITLEAMSIAQKADFFEEIYGIRPVLKQKKRV